MLSRGRKFQNNHVVTRCLLSHRSCHRLCSSSQLFPEGDIIGPMEPSARHLWELRLVSSAFSFLQLQTNGYAGRFLYRNALLVLSGNDGHETLCFCRVQPQLGWYQSKHLQGKSVCTAEVWVPGRHLAAGPAQHPATLLTAQCYL